MGIGYPVGAQIEMGGDPINYGKGLESREVASAVTDETSHFYVLDMFSGAGGFSLGFKEAGFRIVGGIDIDRKAVETYRFNFGARKGIRADIRSVRKPSSFLRRYLGVSKVDVLIAGLPCQPFSLVGRIKLRSLGRSVDTDPRTFLFLDFLRFLRELLPCTFIVENVPDMEKLPLIDGLTVPEIIREQAEELGYSVEWRVLDAVNYGVPQRRKRLFLIGTRCSSSIYWPTPVDGDPVTVWEAISDLPKIGPGFRKNPIGYKQNNEEDLSSYQRMMRRGSPDLLYNHITRWHREDDLLIFKILPEGGKYTDVPEYLRRYDISKFKDRYRKLKKNEPSWTIEAHISKDSYRYIYPSAPYSEIEPHRTISVREAARIQSFPDRFVFPVSMTAAFRQIGNAVPPLLAKALANSIKRTLK